MNQKQKQKKSEIIDDSVLEQEKTNQLTEEKESLEEKLNKENEKLKKENQELEKERLFLLAEMNNKQAEMKRELKDVRDYGNKKIILWVLRFLNDLDERALKFMGQEQDEKIVKHFQGVKMMRDNLWKNLQNEGVKEMEIQEGSDLWNSRYHEFCGEIVDEKLPTGTIVKILSKGYFLVDRVLQPAKVVISKKKLNKIL